MMRGRTSFGLLLLALIVAACEREERDFHVEPAAANTRHTFRMVELQPGTTRPSPHEQATTATAPSTGPATRQGDVIPIGTRNPPATGESLLPPPPAVTAMMTDPPQPLTPAPKDYSRNAYALTEGKRLYTFFNCNGCHANGGGGMGPALMDEVWLYGSAPSDVFKTIVHGRPNGMPAFGGRIPDYQIWQLAHYVRSISGLVKRDAAPSRSDHIKGKPPENTIEPMTPKPATTQ